MAALKRSRSAKEAKYGVLGMSDDQLKNNQDEVEREIRAALRSEPRLGPTS